MPHQADIFQPKKKRFVAVVGDSLRPVLYSTTYLSEYYNFVHTFPSEQVSDITIYVYSKPGW